MSHLLNQKNNLGSSERKYLLALLVVLLVLLLILGPLFLSVLSISRVISLMHDWRGHALIQKLGKIAKTLIFEI